MIGHLLDEPYWNELGEHLRVIYASPATASKKYSVLYTSIYLMDLNPDVMPINELKEALELDLSTLKDNMIESLKQLDLHWHESSKSDGSLIEKEVFDEIKALCALFKKDNNLELLIKAEAEFLKHSEENRQLMNTLYYLKQTEEIDNPRNPDFLETYRQLRDRLVKIRSEL